MNPLYIIELLNTVGVYLILLAVIIDLSRHWDDTV